MNREHHVIALRVRAGCHDAGPLGGKGVIVHLDLIPVGFRGDVVANHADMVLAGLCEGDLVFRVELDAADVQLLLFPDVFLVQLFAAHVPDGDGQTVRPVKSRRFSADKSEIVSRNRDRPGGICLLHDAGDRDLQCGGAHKVAVFGIGTGIVYRRIAALVDDVLEEAGARPYRRIAYVAGRRVLFQLDGGGIVRPLGAVRVDDDPVAVTVAEAVILGAEAVLAPELQIVGVGRLPCLHIHVQVVEVIVVERLAVDKVHVRGQDLHDGQRLKRRDVLDLGIGGVPRLGKGGARRRHRDMRRGAGDAAARRVHRLHPVDALRIRVQVAVLDCPLVEIRPGVRAEGIIVESFYVKKVITMTVQDNLSDRCLVPESDRAIVPCLGFG